MNEVSIIIPVSNEEENLEHCINSVSNAIKRLDFLFKTFIILNGCIDKTNQVAEKCKRKYKSLNITVLSSKKGKMNAQEKAIQRITSKNYVFFLDGDVEIDKKSVEILIKEFKKHKKLIAVGAFPVAKKYSGKNIWKRFLSEVLNIRSRHPQSEISKLNVEDYHPYALSDPQHVHTCPEHELQSKIFFHGRMFALRSKKYWVKPKSKKIVGDDSFIPDSIIFNHGKGRIRIRYDAICYFKPFISIIKHYKTYKRIFFDLKNLKESYLEFRDIRLHSELILNKKYIQNQKVGIRINFAIYSLIRIIEKFFFKFSFRNNPEELWVK